MMWSGDSRVVAGGYFRCRVKYLEWQNSRRENRRRAERCVYCGAPAVTETLCREHADYRADLMAAPQHRLKHQFAQGRYRRRLKSEEGFQPSGDGLAALLAAWTRKDRG
jgi:23S rRNA A2030 N6-methylase RlmJ